MFAPLAPANARSRRPARGGILALAGVLSGWLGCSPESIVGDPAQDLGIGAAGPSLTVAVTDDQTGGAVAGAWVVLQPSGRDATTDASGVALFEAVADGDYTVRAAAPGYGSAEGPAVVMAGADQQAALALQDLRVGTAAVGGRVLAPHSGDAGVPGARIRVDGVVVAESAPDGTYLARGIAPGAHVLELQPPEGAPLLAWVSQPVTMEADTLAIVAAALPGIAPAEAVYIGTDSCAGCHPDEAGRYAATPHALSSRSPTAWQVADPDGMALEFEAGAVVPLEGGLDGARVELSLADGGAWQAAVVGSDGARSGPHAVVEVYGGHRAGAALALDADGTRAILPIGWAHEGVSGAQDQAEAGWVAAWTDGWFDAHGLLTVDAGGAPEPEASWDLRCAGCHAAGGRLVEEGGGRYTLARADGQAGEPERTVGCESCHGPGSLHAAAPDDPVLGPLFNPARVPAWQVLEVCARCHERLDVRGTPFTDEPDWPVADSGDPILPHEVLADRFPAARETWLDLPVSRLHRDQVGDFRGAPHREGAAGYDGACRDCHDAHGSTHPASLRADPTGNDLCLGCHASRFPDAESQGLHSGHRDPRTGTFTPGVCVGCHMPRSGAALRPDALSGAGEVRSHALLAWPPEAALAEFDAAGADELALGQAPVPGCLDCHIQADALLEDAGSACACPASDPRERQTYLDLGVFYDVFFPGVSP